MDHAVVITGSSGYLGERGHIQCPGRVFSDWCELPPLYSLIRLWSRRGSIGRCFPGRGRTGFPYIHRDELVRFVRRVIEKNDVLSRHEVLFASEDGCTCHDDLFPPIRRIEAT